MLLLFVLHLESDTDIGRIIERVGVGRERTLQFKHHAAYIRVVLQMEDGGEMAADARSQMVNAVPATDGKPYVY